METKIIAASIFASTLILSGCASIGESSGKAPSQLRAEREARRAEIPLPISPRLLGAANDAEADRVKAELADISRGDF